MIFFFLFVFIISSVFKTKKEWNSIFSWWNWGIAGSSLLSFVVFVTNNLIASRSVFDTRFQGFTGNPIYFAAILLVFFFINLYLFFEKVSQNAKIKQLLPYITVAILYIVFILMSGTRGALVALGVTGFILLTSLIANKSKELEDIFKINFQKTALWILIVIVSFAIAIFALKDTRLIKSNYILFRLTNINAKDNASFSRIVVSKIALDCFKEKPLTGWGFDNFEICFQQHFDQETSEMLPIEKRFDKTHNMPFEIMATNGLLGIIAFLGIYFFAYKYIRDAITNDKIYFYSGLSIILAILVYFIQNLFVFDVFEGLLAICLVFGFSAALSEESQKTIALNIHRYIKDIILIIFSLLVVFYVFNINYQEYKSTKIPREIDLLLKNNKEDEAIEKIKSISNTKYSNKGDLYMGSFNLLIQEKRPLTPNNRELYHNLVADELIKIIQKRPYLTKSYVLAIIHLSSKVNFEEMTIADHDITRAKYLYDRSKQYNLNQPEMETYYSLILLSSKKESDVKDGVAILEHAIKYYPEKGIFNLMYGHYLLEKSNDKAEAIKQIKSGLEKPGAIETLSQLSRSLKALLNQKETDFVIKIATNYLPQNSHRMELFMILSEAYLQKNDYAKSFENYKTAQEMYDKVKVYHYSSTIEKELLDLQTRINKIK